MPQVLIRRIALALAGLVAVSGVAVFASPTGAEGTNLLAKDPARHPVSSVAPVPLQVALPNPSWQELNPSQREILVPLSQKWDELPAVRKQRWLKLAEEYQKSPPEKQPVLRNRIQQWSSLDIKERQKARQNFTQARSKTKPTQRAEAWQKYQQLSPDKKALLQAKAKAAKKLEKTAPPAVPTPFVQ